MATWFYAFEPSNLPCGEVYDNYSLEYDQTMYAMQVSVDRGLSRFLIGSKAISSLGHRSLCDMSCLTSPMEYAFPVDMYSTGRNQMGLTNVETAIKSTPRYAIGHAHDDTALFVTIGSPVLQCLHQDEAMRSALR
jgi:hypothetical protein